MRRRRPAARLRTEAPAKANLFLEVLRRRPDGFHDIDTVMVPLPSLADDVEVAVGPGEGIACSVRADPAWGIPGGEGNLAHRAARAWLAAAGADAAVGIRIRKRIPPGAGLGGGSSDAAAVLRLLDRHAAAGRLPGRRPALRPLAAALGSDVPFFLAGVPARARGRGERLVPVAAPRRPRLLLCWPGVPCSTAAVYARVRPPAPRERRSAAPLLAALRRGSAAAVAAACANRLAAPAREVRPEVGAALDALASLGAGPPSVTGSGSACFLVVPRGGSGGSLARRLRRRVPGDWIVVDEN